MDLHCVKLHICTYVRTNACTHNDVKCQRETLLIHFKSTVDITSFFLYVALRNSRVHTPKGVEPS